MRSAALVLVLTALAGGCRTTWRCPPPEPERTCRGCDERASRAVREAVERGEPRPGVLALFYSSLDLAGRPRVALLPDLRLDCGGAPEPGVSEDFSSRFVTRLEVPRGGRYEIEAYVDDGVRLWIDGRLVLEDWVHEAKVRRTPAIPLHAGFHDLVLEQFDRGGPAAVRLSWRSRPDAELAPIPWELYHVPEGLLEAVERLHDALAPADGREGTMLGALLR